MTESSSRVPTVVFNQSDVPHSQEGGGSSGGTSGGGRVVLRHRGVGRRERHTHNGIVFSRPKSEYISPAGISALDIRTRLRITEAELAIVQRELSDLLAERNILEASSRQYEESWRFTVSEFGRIVLERDELRKKYEALEQAIAAVPQTSPEMKGRKTSKVPRANLEQLRLSYETQVRVSEVLEQERDRAFDDYEMAQVQLHTLFSQYQDLASSCSEVARERDKLKGEVQLLRDELHRCEADGDLSSSRGSLKKTDSSTGSGGSLASVSVSVASGGGGDSDENQSTDPQVLSQQLKEAREERDKINTKYEQLMKRADQFQKQLYRAEEDRRQALATSEALTSLWQKKFDKAQNENYDLRQELLSAHERISLLQDRLALQRLQSNGSTLCRPSPPEGGGAGESILTNHGRHSPQKASTSTLGSLWGAKVNSSNTTMVSSESSLGFGTTRTSSGGMPQRTSSFHGFNQVTHYQSSQGTGYGLSSNASSSSQSLSSKGHGITRSGSLKSPQELMPPSFSFSFNRSPQSKQLLQPEENGLGGDQHSTDDEGSWI